MSYCMKIRENLTSFYNSWLQSIIKRGKKYWAEGDIIIKVLETRSLDHIKILELDVAQEEQFLG